MSVRWNGWQAVLDQRERTRERQKRWIGLDELAKQKRLAEFWDAYADYLQWDGIYSNGRRTLYEAARSTSQKLKPAPEAA